MYIQIYIVNYLQMVSIELLTVIEKYDFIPSIFSHCLSVNLIFYEEGVLFSECEAFRIERQLYNKFHFHPLN